MKNLLVLSLAGLVLVLVGCAKQTATTNQEVKQPAANVNQEVNPPATNAADNQTPQIISATFDGNAVVIQGKNLNGSYVAFTAPSSETPCREMITPTCVLEKTESTDATIKFISNSIGDNGSYQIYVENPTTGASNQVNMTIPTTPSL